MASKKKPLKVYGWTNPRRRESQGAHKQATEVVAAHSKTEAASLFAGHCTVGQVSEWADTTKVQFALAEPGVVFWKPLDAYGQAYIRAGEQWADTAKQDAPKPAKVIDARLKPRDDGFPRVSVTAPEDMPWGDACEVAAMRRMLILGDLRMRESGIAGAPHVVNMVCAAMSTPNEFRSALRRAGYDPDEIEDEVKWVRENAE